MRIHPLKSFQNYQRIMYKIIFAINPKMENSKQDSCSGAPRAAEVKDESYPILEHDRNRDPDRPHACERVQLPSVLSALPPCVHISPRARNCVRRNRIREEERAASANTLRLRPLSSALALRYLSSLRALRSTICSADSIKVFIKSIVNLY